MTTNGTRSTLSASSGGIRSLSEDLRESSAARRRICIATDDIVGPVRNGGIGTAYSGLAQVLAAAGHDVTVLYTASQVCESESIDHWIDYYARLGVHFVALPAPEGEVGASRALVVSYSIYEWLKQHSFDIVHFPDWQGRAYYSCLAKRQGLAFADTLLCIGTHGPRSWNRMGNESFPSTTDQLETEFMERRAVEAADVVISPSRFMLEWMRGCGWKLPARSFVHQNVLLGEHAAAPAQEQEARLREVVFFGRLEKRKGLELFCGALDRLAQGKETPGAAFTVTFLGKSGDMERVSGKDFVMQRAPAWPWNVEMISDFDHRQAIAYLREPGRLAVIPSLTDNSPFTVLECLGHGISVIACDVGGIAELIAADDRQRVCFEPKDEALARRLTDLARTGLRPAAQAVSSRATCEGWIDWHGTVRIAPSTRQTPGSSPRVSVCLLHFNRPNYLRHAIDSLRCQDYDNFEVVLVDDGSTDPAALQFLDSLETEFHTRSWKLLREKNRFRGAARNSAAQVASGEYLLFMDDDNCAMPHEISTFVKAATNSGADVLTCCMETFAGDGAPVPSGAGRRWLFLGGCAPVGLFRNCFGDTNALFRTSVFRALGGFGEEYGIGHEDWELLARAVVAGYRLEVVPEALFWYRQSEVGRERRTRNSYRFHLNSLKPYLQAVPESLRDIILLAHGQNVHRGGLTDIRASAVAVDVKASIRAARTVGLRGDTDGSMQLFKEAMDAAQLSGQTPLILEVLLNTAKLLADIGRWGPALQLVNDALDVAASAAHFGAVAQARELQAYVVQGAAMGSGGHAAAPAAATAAGKRA